MHPAFILGGLAALGMLAAIVAKGAETDETEAESLLANLEALRGNVLAQFDITEGCTRISYTGDSDEAAEFWAGPANQYLKVAVELARKADLKEPAAVTEYVAKDLFPQCEWPPPTGALVRVDQKAVWFGLRAAVEKEMGA